MLRNLFILFAMCAVLIPLLPVPERRGRRRPKFRIASSSWSSRRRRRRRHLRRPRSKRRSPSREAVEQPKPQPRPQDAREKAQQSGLLKLQDQLADLRDNSVLDKAAATKNLTGKVGETTSSERSLITSKVGAQQRRHQYRGAEPRLRRRRRLADRAHDDAGDFCRARTRKPTTACSAAPGSNKASRSEEEIALVFDRNKGAIYALYTRALRDKPELQGKLVLELTIAPDGSVTRCDVVSSELNDPELERKLVARVKLFRFEAKDVGTITVTKPIDFFPA